MKIIEQPSKNCAIHTCKMCGTKFEFNIYTDVIEGIIEVGEYLGIINFVYCPNCYDEIRVNFIERR